MENQVKKRGRTAAAKKDSAMLEATPHLASEDEPVQVKPLKGKGKRQVVPVETEDVGDVSKKSKLNDPEIANQQVESVVPVKAKAPAAKKGRTKKDAAGEPTAPENKPSKKTTKASSKAADSNGDNESNNTGSTVETNGLPITQPAKPSKRGRGKQPSYKEEDSDEPEYVPKPTKGRAVVKGKVEKKSEQEVVASEDKSSAAKPTPNAEVPPAAESPKAKSAGRGKKPAPVAKETADDEAAFVTKRKNPAKPTSKKEAAITSATSKPAARGRKKALAAEAAADEDNAEASNEEPVPTKSNSKPSSKKKETSESSAVAKPTARGRKKASVPDAANEDHTDNGNAKTAAAAAEEITGPATNLGVTQRKRGKAKTDDGQEDTTAVAKGQPKEKKAKVAAPEMNKCATDYSSITFDMPDKPWNFKISSWNVAGLRSWVGKGGLDFLEHERPDILCVQETKCTEDQLPDEARHIPGYHPYWLCKPGGYAGVAIYSKKMPFHVTYGLGDEEQDQAGRLLTAEYEKFYLVCVYVPNAGNKLVTLPKRMRWDEKFHQYLAELDSKKPVILCGDMNVAHEEIDLANPKTNRKNAGFTQEERDGMTKLLSLGFVDTFRRLYPDRKSAYTFWTYMGGARAKNVGWRLDYFILSERLVEKVTDNVIRTQVFGSDHCPVTLFLNL